MKLHPFLTMKSAREIDNLARRQGIGVGVGVGFSQGRNCDAELAGDGNPSVARSNRVMATLSGLELAGARIGQSSGPGRETSVDSVNYPCQYEMKSTSVLSEHSPERLSLEVGKPATRPEARAMPTAETTEKRIVASVCGWVLCNSVADCEC